MKIRLIEKTIEFSSAYSDVTEAIDVGVAGGDSFSCVAVVDVDTPSAKTTPSSDIDYQDDLWTEVGHGFSTGLKVQLTTSGTLPSPLLAATDYFVIVVDDDSFKLAASLSDAQAGTAITLADAGVGNQTVTPTALAGGSIKLQQSNDAVNWIDLGSSTNITADTVLLLEKDRPTTRYIRVSISLTAGHISADLEILVKGDRE